MFFLSTKITFIEHSGCYQSELEWKCSLTPWTPPSAKAAGRERSPASPRPARHSGRHSAILGTWCSVPAMRQASGLSSSRELLPTGKGRVSTGKGSRVLHTTLPSLPVGERGLGDGCPQVTSHYQRPPAPPLPKNKLYIYWHQHHGLKLPRRRVRPWIGGLTLRSAPGGRGREACGAGRPAWGETQALPGGRHPAAGEPRLPARPGAGRGLRPPPPSPEQGASAAGPGWVRAALQVARTGSHFESRRARKGPY